VFSTIERVERFTRNKTYKNIYRYIISRHTTTNTTTSVWMVSPHTQYINMKFSTNSCINILYFNVDFKLLFKTSPFYICKLNYLDFYVIYSSKNTTLKVATIGGRNMWDATLFIVKQICISVYALVCRISHNESSVRGHKSFKIGHESFTTCILLKYNTYSLVTLNIFRRQL